jgi:predicted nicotinamide N-methyase
VRDAAAIADVERSLRRRFRVVETTVPVGAHALAILHPSSAEELIDERDFERDERLPYWAELWPSSRVLGEVVLALPGKGRSLLELGCGSGLVSACAAIAGFDVTVSDYYEDACRFASVNVHRNTGTTPRELHLDWRHLPSEPQQFDVVLASDVLYERPYGALVARAIGASLTTDGVAYVADPGRVGREDFRNALGGNGLEIRRGKEHPFVDGRIRQSIAVFEIRRLAIATRSLES